MTRLLAGIVLLVFTLCPALASSNCSAEGENHSALYPDATRFLEAITTEESHPASAKRLSGITVPHHLVAGHLIARGFRAASGFSYDRVIVLTPDHFSRSKAPFATTRHGFETPLGPVEVDGEAVQALLADETVEESCLFEREHGLHALLPFLRRNLPGAKLVPVAISLRAKRADWDRLIELLAPLAGETTLVVQSTDFSHYHPHEKARQFDQQTLNVIASGSLDEVAMLSQPDHLDSLGSLYVQMKLQAQRHGAVPIVISSENQQQYTSRRVDRTTSYMVLLFGRVEDGDAPHEDSAELVYFAGDVHFGRAMTQALADADAGERVADAVLARTHGRPLIVNLEGVILPNVPEALEHMTIAMPEMLTIDWLRRLNVTGVGLANNHAMDLGPSGFAETKAALADAKIASFAQGESLDIGALTVVGLSDLDSNGPPFTDLVSPALLDRLIVADARRPIVAFVHWGREYVASPAARETWLAEEMRLRGVSLIVGGHPHVTDGKLTPLGGGEAIMAYSLGNFLFDQTERRASGALLELRVFEQGTFFARLLPLPNLFDLATGR